MKIETYIAKLSKFNLNDSSPISELVSQIVKAAEAVNQDIYSRSDIESLLHDINMLKQSVDSKEELKTVKQIEKLTKDILQQLG
jgi:hypothetical protein